MVGLVLVRNGEVWRSCLGRVCLGQAGRGGRGLEGVFGSVKVRSGGSVMVCRGLVQCGPIGLGGQVVVRKGPA